MTFLKKTFMFLLFCSAPLHADPPRSPYKHRNAKGFDQTEEQVVEIITDLIESAKSDCAARTFYSNKPDDSGGSFVSIKAEVCETSAPSSLPSSLTSSPKKVVDGSISPSRLKTPASDASVIITQLIIRGWNGISSLRFLQHPLLVVQSLPKTLQSLEVSLCDITELDVNASTFKDYRLKILKLSGNLISRITPQAGINPLIFLEELYLDLNGLQHLANAFAHGTSNLRILDLSDNCISTLEASSLSALHKLEKLDLKSNLLRDDSVSMRAFEEVGLEASQFSLNLSYNALQSFPPLQPLCAYVTELNLNGNPLKSVPRLSGERGYAFDTLKILHIHSYLRSAEDNALLVRKMKTKTPQNCRIVTDIETVDGYETPEE